MWLSLAQDGAEGPEDDWIRDLYRRDISAASVQDRETAADMMEARAKGPAASAMSRLVVRTLQILRPLGIPMMAAAPAAPPPPPARASASACGWAPDGLPNGLATRGGTA